MIETTNHNWELESYKNNAGSTQVGTVGEYKLRNWQSLTEYLKLQ